VQTGSLGYISQPEACSFLSVDPAVDPVVPLHQLYAERKSNMLLYSAQVHHGSIIKYCCQLQQCISEQVLT